MPCYTAVARLGFKRRATAVPNSIINYKYIRIHFKSSLNRVLFFFYFCFPQQLLYSTELNSTSKTSQLRSAVARRLKQALLAYPSILGLWLTNVSYISLQILANPLHEKQLSEKVAGLPFFLWTLRLADPVNSVNVRQSEHASAWVNFFSRLTQLEGLTSLPGQLFSIKTWSNSWRINDGITTLYLKFFISLTFSFLNLIYYTS